MNLNNPQTGQLSALSNNIMKVSSEALSYGQVKSVHGQISRDCSLLRNRVRLLQSEMERSNKKIDNRMAGVLGSGNNSLISESSNQQS